MDLPMLLIDQTQGEGSLGLGMGDFCEKSPSLGTFGSDHVITPKCQGKAADFPLYHGFDANLGECPWVAGVIVG